MKSILLTGGTSSRFAPLGSKHLVELMGRTVLEHHVEKLQAVGVHDHVVICNEQDHDAFQKILDGLKVTYTLVVQHNPKGMADGLLQARDVIGEGPIWISTPGDIVEQDAFTLMESALEDGCDGVLLGYTVDEYFPGGYIEVQENDRITSIVEKPGAGKEPSNVVNLVSHIHGSAAVLWEALEQTTTVNDDHYEVALHELFQKYTYKVARYNGKWCPLKYPWMLLDALEYMLGTLQETVIAEGVTIPDTARVHGPVVIESGVKIFDNAVIKGPCYIGKNAVIGTNGFVRESIIGEGSVVGSNTEIARSLFGRSVWTHGNYIGDSVCMHNVSFGAGSTTANLRLDEGGIVVNVKGESIATGHKKLGIFVGSDVRCGANITFMPGVKIGGGSFVGAGLILDRNVEDGQFVYQKSVLEVRTNRVSQVEQR